VEGAQDLGLAEHAKADAVGEPGRRTFRVRVATPTATACFWMEKEQLQALGMAIDQLLAQLRSNKVGEIESPAPASESGDFPTTFTHDFRVGRLGLGYDEDGDRLVLLVHDQEANLEGPPTLQVKVERGKGRTLSAEITTVVASGRPRCPLCGAPLTGGPHACPGSNGKAPYPINGGERQ
jgi:uncharacterized repeat protein (TIGR03847 family)